MVVQAVYIVLVPASRASDHGWELPLQLSVTISALGILVLLLGINQVKTISHWVVSSMLIIALILLALFSDNPHEVINGRSSMFFLVPILLSGVLIHSFATIHTTLQPN